jgi:hypothetical protein
VHPLELLPLLPPLPDPPEELLEDSLASGEMQLVHASALASVEVRAEPPQLRATAAAGVPRTMTMLTAIRVIDPSLVRIEVAKGGR